MWDACHAVIAPGAFDIEIQSRGPDVVLTVRGDLDIATVGELELAQARALEDQPSRLLIDLRAVAFVDSSGLKLLLQAHSLAERDGWKLELLGPAPTAHSVFVVTGADRLLPFVDRAEGWNATGSDHGGSLRSAEPCALRLDLDPAPTAAAAARAALRGLLPDDFAPAVERELLALLVSEVVTNAIKHAGPPQRGIEFGVEVNPTHTRVVVTDGGPGFERTAQRRSPGFGPGGYGIFLLDSEASRWGTERAPSGFSVWFELDHAPGSDLSAAWPAAR
jgi:anti-anti-sigma factor